MTMVPRQFARAFLFSLVWGIPAVLQAEPLSADSGGRSLKQIVLSPQARLAAAQQEGGAFAALQAYEALAADSTAPDSIRMIAAGRRADEAFAIRQYQAARDYYARAAHFEKTAGWYRYRLALATLAGGDTAGAAALLVTVADKGEPACIHEAQTVLGELALKRGKCREAYGFFLKTGPFSVNNSWSVPACIGKLAAARCLGYADSAAAYERLLAANEPALLEKERLRQVRETPLASAQDSAASMKPAAAGNSGKKIAPAVTAASDSSFTLQVGAFESKNRAVALKKRLAPKFPDVSCVTAIINEQAFFRVCVGTFRTRGQAERFGSERLHRHGMGYRVVIK